MSDQQEVLMTSEVRLWRKRFVRGCALFPTHPDPHAPTCPVLQVNVVFQELDHGPMDDVFELRSAAVVMLLSLLEGHNARTRPNMMLERLDFHSMGRILDHMWKEVCRLGCRCATVVKGTPSRPCVCTTPCPCYTT